MNADCQRALLNLDREMDTAEAGWQNGHVSVCKECGKETAARERVQIGLRRAVRTAPVDAAMEQGIRELLAANRPRRQWRRYAAAAALLIAAASYWILPWAENRMAESAYFQSLPRSVSRIMRVGLSDHVHCAAYRKFRKPPAAEDLPAPFRQVLSHIPAAYRVMAAHECKAQGRSFIHFVMRGADEKTVSLVVARKEPGETFATSSLRRAAGALPVFTEDVPDYQIAGFEASSFLVFVVSDMGRPEHQQLALQLAGPVTAMLNTLG